jgi:nitrogen PTS system EIIA component
MKITEILAPENVVVDLRASGKTRLLMELSRSAARALGIDAEVVLTALTRRENLGSTGLGGGIAIPHARLPEVSAPFGFFVRLQSPIPFEAVDDQPVDIVFLLLLPSAPAGEQLSALACVARRLRDATVSKALRRARDHVAFYEVLMAGCTEKKESDARLT